MRMRIKEDNGYLSIDNGQIRASFVKASEGNIVQTYYGLDEKADWIAIASSFFVPAVTPEGTAPLFSDQYADEQYRLLVCNSLNQLDLLEQSENFVKLLLSGNIHKHYIEMTICLHADDDFFSIQVTAELAGEPKLDYLLSTFSFMSGSPDFIHTPSIKRDPEHVHGDRVFFAPAIILQKDALFAAIVPDLDLLKTNQVYSEGTRAPRGNIHLKIVEESHRTTLPTGLDLELQSGISESPLFSYGYLDYTVEQHVYFMHENKSGASIRSLSSNRLTYGFDLFLSARALKSRGFQKVSQHLWKRYGAACFQEPRPQAMPFFEYAKACYPAAFAYKGDSAEDVKRYMSNLAYDPDVSGPLETWLEFEWEGKQVGGIRSTPTQWYYDIQFMGWWNNARLANGMLWWGEQIEDEELANKAKLIIELILTAPQQEGIFPTVFRYSDKADERRWIGNYWRPTLPYEPLLLANYWDMDSEYYQACGCSKTAVHLLKYYSQGGNDQRILDFVVAYGDFIVNHIDDDGGFAAWFDADLQPLPHIRFNSEGGIHIWFLAELFRQTGKEEYLQTAKKMAEFMLDKIIPTQIWHDFETFCSCTLKPEGTIDSHTGQPMRNNLSLIWAMEGFASLYEVTLSDDYLQTSELLTDYCGFYQAVWQPPYVFSAYVFGGCTTQNSDAEWLDMRQSQFGEALVRIAELTGRQDLLERGIAALRAQFALINHPRHIDNDIFRYPRYPFGISPENVDHDGIPQSPLRSGFDWGEGGGLSAVASIMGSLGGAFIHVDKGLSVGVDAVSIESFFIEGDLIRVELKNMVSNLPFPYLPDFPICLKICGLKQGTYRLVVNADSQILTNNIELDMGIKVKVKSIKNSLYKGAGLC